MSKAIGVSGVEGHARSGSRLCLGGLQIPKQRGSSPQCDRFQGISRYQALPNTSLPLLNDWRAR